ncbi:23S rRNA (adenine(2030)-N(6))-methyltransferase RlmJ [Stappia sp. GBMRC 2046]|uniref:Ribosomal RNA large subunit methyltransferase J n=1 Tax=Stappia sediminis TaxID=2692190 RepID=A0A7X3S5Q4_9HYPH|nr:23S rRNA (adenine(2030)-N(6))-methyltransferase RlmJ [Stappia sediminis]MXN63391.1 23S rRNA (adenine(2030)-N(6))-methyltransferase RlmJ [Stappia sediminis]
MNYRHIYHAGNIGDVLKHVALALIIDYLKRKPAAFRVIDTHAGIGLYDLSSDEAHKTGEWQRGVGRVLDAQIPERVRTVLAPWAEAVSAVNHGGPLASYPGSPEIARRLIRRQDRLTLTELHPRDFETLSALYAGDIQVKTIELDGWLALKSFLPPKERRGLVVIDPAFEDEREFETLAKGLIEGWKRWSSGIFLAWYPIKDRKAIDRFHSRLRDSGMRDVIALELSAGRPASDKPMVSSGLVVVNPPWTFAADMETALPFLGETLREGPGAGWKCVSIVDE